MTADSIPTPQNEGKAETLYKTRGPPETASPYRFSQRYVVGVRFARPRTAKGRPCNPVPEAMCQLLDVSVLSRYSLGVIPIIFLNVAEK